MMFEEKTCAANDPKKNDILQIAQAAGFYFNDIGYGPIVHSNALNYSEHCFHRFADGVIRYTNQGVVKPSQLDNVYRERNTLVALLARVFPSGIKKTVIEGWDPEWHNCCYIDFPWGQASWHYHDHDADLFAGLPAYNGEWDGHTTQEKYDAIEKNMCTFTQK